MPGRNLFIELQSWKQAVNQLDFVSTALQVRMLVEEPDSCARKSRLHEFKIPSNSIGGERIPRFELHCMICHDLPCNAFTLHSKTFRLSVFFSFLLPLLPLLPPTSNNSRVANKNLQNATFTTHRNYTWVVNNTFEVQFLRFWGKYFVFGKSCASPAAKYHPRPTSNHSGVANKNLQNKTFTTQRLFEAPESWTIS